MCLLIFQAMILFDAYQLRKESIEKDVKNLFRVSVEKEVSIRLKESEMGDEIPLVSIDKESYEKDTIYSKIEGHDLNQSEMMEAGVFQQVLQYAYGIPFRIHTLDSIFGNDIRSVGIHGTYSLVYCDSLGNNNQKTDYLTSKQLNKAFKTDALLIVAGNRIQAHVYISPPDVYKSMLSLLISSFIIMFFLGFFLIYQTNTIFTQKKLESLKSDFIHAFIHNIKSPLGVIKTIIMKLYQGQLDSLPEIKGKFFKTGIIQVENMMNQAEKILTIVKLEKGQSTIVRSHTDIYEMIAELKDKFAVSNDKQVNLHTSVDIDNEKIIYIDKTQIKEAISNLIENAIKYSGDSVNIKINCFIVENTLHISVTDNGFGISQKDQPTIFEKFERGDAVKRKEAKGFGLGLSFVKYVTEAHGGIVSLFSTIGEGSEFTILLPIQSELL